MSDPINKTLPSKSIEGPKKCPFNLENNKNKFLLFLNKIKDAVSWLLSSDALDFEKEKKENIEYLELIVDRVCNNLRLYLQVKEIRCVSLEAINEYIEEKSNFLREMAKPISTSIMDIYMHYLLCKNGYSSEKESKKCLQIHMVFGIHTVKSHLEHSNFFNKNENEKNLFVDRLTNYFIKIKNPRSCHFSRSNNKKEYVDRIWDFLEKEFQPKLKERFIENIDEYKKFKDEEAFFILGELKNK